MSFHEVRLPEYIEKGATGGPGFNTTISEMSSGYEKRNMNWSQARASYDIAYGVKNQSDIRTVLAFFYARRGRAHGFRFKDWTDFFTFASPIGTGNGVLDTYQLTITYGDYVRIIKKPVAGTVKIYLDGIFTPLGWSADTTTGIVTFDDPVSDTTVITADFQFDVPVRFDTDNLQLSLEFVSPSEDQVYGTVPSINLMEIRQ